MSCAASLPQIGEWRHSDRMPRFMQLLARVTDATASSVRTAESKDRSDIQAAPDGVLLVEGCSPDLVKAASDMASQHAVACGALTPVAGLYRLEYTRLKNAHAYG